MRKSLWRIDLFWPTLLGQILIGFQRTRKSMTTICVYTLSVSCLLCSLQSVLIKSGSDSFTSSLESIEASLVSESTDMSCQWTVNSRIIWWICIKLIHGLGRCIHPFSVMSVVILPRDCLSSQLGPESLPVWIRPEALACRIYPNELMILTPKQ